MCQVLLKTSVLSLYSVLCHRGSEPSNYVCKVPMSMECLVGDLRWEKKKYVSSDDAFAVVTSVSGIGRQLINAENSRLYWHLWGFGPQRSIALALLLLLCGTSTAFSKQLASVWSRASAKRWKQRFYRCSYSSSLCSSSLLFLCYPSLSNNLLINFLH